MAETRCVLFDEDHIPVGVYPDFKAAHDAWKPLWDEGRCTRKYYIGIISRVSEPAAPIVDVNE